MLIGDVGIRGAGPGTVDAVVAELEHSNECGRVIVVAEINRILF